MRSGGVSGPEKMVAGAGQGAVAGGTVPQASPEPAGPLSEELWKEILVNPAAAKGPENAKVTMVEFTDYQCPFCGRHFSQTDGQIQESYVESGKMRHIVRDLPLPFHANAHVAAQAARCAGDQNKYWQMHDKLFEAQEEWSAGDPVAKFGGYAGELGMNLATFEGCVTGGKYKGAVDDDLALANKVGASGTPTFFINGQILVGAQPYSAFETAIEKELEN
jgi:protein-disulfide isomerase